MPTIPTQLLQHENKHKAYSQQLTIKINKTINNLLLLPITQKNQIYKILLQTITSANIQDWLIIKYIFQSPITKNNPNLYKLYLQIIQNLMFQNQQSYIMRVYLYGLMKQNNIKFTYGRTLRQLKMFVQQGKLSMFNSWLIETIQCKQTLQTLDMLCQYYPIVLLQQKLIIQLPQLQFMLHIILHMQITQSFQFENIDKLLASIKTYRMSLTNSRNMINSNHNIYTLQSQQQPFQQSSPFIIDNEQHQIINLTIDILSHSKSSTGNCIWIFTQNMMKQTDIRSYIAIHGQLVMKYSQQQLVNMFKKMFSYSLEKNTLALFRQLSYALKQAQKFYQLKVLYKQILLPIIIYRGKAKQNLQHKILQLASFYIIGFYQHCDIGRNGIICILTNINKLQHIKQIQQQWIQLALLLGEKNIQQYLQIVYLSLKKQGINENQIKKIDQFKGFDHFQQYQIWEITIRNSKKLKSYNKNISKSYKGIQNNHLQCYIISVIQALFTTIELPKILLEFYSAKWTTLSYHIKQLFKNLKANDYKGRITVDNVKKYSPQQFAFQDKQQDAQQYLSKVLQQIQSQLTQSKQNLLLEQFYKTFRFKILRKLQCQNCQYVIDKSEELFIHTIPNKTSIREYYVQEIQGYKCQKCTKTKFLNKTTFSPTSKILIIHINRFSFTNGKSRKQLATQPIKRDFLNYRLKGMIFHIGKIVQCGHYVYYFNQGGKKWIQMNDQQVNQFQLQNENQQFQRQMKAQITPYILFYLRK